MAAFQAGNFEDLQYQVKIDFKEDLNSERVKCNLSEFKQNTFLYYSDAQKCMYIQPVQSKKGCSQKSQIQQKLSLTTAPLFAVSKLKCSITGNHALLFGKHGLAIVELPRKWGDDNLFEGGKTKIQCRSTILDQSFYEHHLSIEVVNASWYPGSPTDSHLLVLTTDNCLRIYDITRPEQPMLRLPLFDNVSETSKNRLSMVLGETVVNMAIAPPKEDSLGNKVYPVYVMQESGDVWVLHCKFAQNRIHVEQQGPLVMNPPADDNYGCNFCTLLCLPTTPVTLALATKTGTVYNCVVIVGDEEMDEMGNKSVSDYVERFPTESLYVYETIKLEMNLLNSSRQQVIGDPPELSDIMLIRDKSTTDRYISVSSGGIHTITLPWVHELSNFFGSDSQHCNQMENPADVLYLLCTKPVEDSHACVTVCGCSVFEDGSTLMCILSNGELVPLQLRKPSEQHWEDNKPEAINRHFSSPLRQLRGVGQFQTYISKMLVKEATIPIIKCGGSDDLIPPDVYFKLLTKTTQVLREEYIQKMLLAKAELDKRCKILREKKMEQLEELDLLQNDQTLGDKGEELATKLEQAQENMAAITDRVSKVFRRIQRSSPVLSHEEKEWAQELKLMQNKVNKLKKFSEVIKTKHQNLVLQSTPMSLVNKSTSKPSMATTQAIKIRGVLKDQGSVISQLVDEVNALSVRVGT